MRLYDPADEEALFFQRRAAAWRRSGLLSDGELEGARRLAPPLRRAAVFLRLALFGFTILALAAATAGVDWLLGLDGGAARAWWLMAGAAAYAGAELLARRARLHRHGVEEACAAFALAMLLFVLADLMRWNAWRSIDDGALWLAFTAGAFLLYGRFGFLYAAMGGFLGLAGLSFTLFDGPLAARGFLLAALGAGLLFFSRRDGLEAPAFRREESGILTGVLVLAASLAANLRLPDLGAFARGASLRPHAGVAPGAYWASYLFLFAWPLAVLAAAARRRHKPAAVGAAMGLVIALCTNKDYWGLTHYAWDPAVLGLALIAASWALHRRLAGEGRGGWTSEETVVPPDHGLAAGALAAGAAGLRAMDGPPAGAPGGDPAGGGRSGGGGASGGF